jgi:dTDP-4-dehydrorhamnose 3,5-epimerase
MQITEAPIRGVFRLQTAPVADARGWFGRLYCADELREAGVPQFQLAQANWSHTRQRGAFRGLHYQEAPHAETKIVRCVRGTVVDMVVDLRSGSPTFLQVHYEELSDKATNALLIPKGCAHGFQVLSPGADLLYLHHTAYNAAAARAVNVKSPVLAIVLPLGVTEISERDRCAPVLPEGFEGIPA